MRPPTAPDHKTPNEALTQAIQVLGAFLGSVLVSRGLALSFEFAVGLWLLIWVIIDF